MFPPHTIYIPELPTCNFCNEKAIYDGKTHTEKWAYMCQKHFVEKGVGLGIGLGQKLIARPASASDL